MQKDGSSEVYHLKLKKIPSLFGNSLGVKLKLDQGLVT